MMQHMRGKSTQIHINPLVVSDFEHEREIVSNHADLCRAAWIRYVAYGNTHHERPICSFLDRIKVNLLYLPFLLTIFTCVATDIQLTLTTMDNAPLQEAGAGQPFLLHVTINNAGNTAQYPEIRNSDKFHMHSSGFQMNMINGVTNITYQYRVRIDTPGTYTLGPASITQGGTSMASEPITVTVSTEEKSSTSTHNKRNNDSINGFAQLKTEKKEAFVGEKIPCTLTFYTPDQGVRIQQIIEPDLPDSAECIIKKKSEPTSGVESLNGRSHFYVRFHFDVYPRTAGTITIPAYAFDVSTGTNTGFFSFILAHNPKTKRIQSNALTLSVVPLPSYHKKAAFIGSIHEVSAVIEPTHATLAQGTTLRITITGTGTLDQLEFIPLHGMPTHLKWYESKQNTEYILSQPNTFKHVMEYTIQALSAGTYTIPAQEIVAFDPISKRYDSHTTPQCILTVTGTAPVSSTPSAPTAAPEIEAPPVESPSQSVIIPWFWFWMITILISVVGISSLLHTLYTTKKESVYRLIAWRYYNPYQRARTALKTCEKEARADTVHALFITLFAQKFAQPQETITAERIMAYAHEKKLSPTLCNRWNEFFTTVTEYTYGSSDKKQLSSELITQAYTWIDIWEKLQ